MLLYVISAEKKYNHPVNAAMCLGVKKREDKTHPRKPTRYYIDFLGTEIYWRYVPGDEATRDADFEEILKRIS
jgi:hypothetical protein